MRPAALTALLALWLAACAPRSSEAPSPWPRPDDAVSSTPAGTVVHVPAWVPAAERAAVYDEIDATYRLVGLAPGELAVQITIPIYEAPYSPTGLARGEYRAAERLVVAGWRIRGLDSLYLPALAHELRHHLYGPERGHEEVQR